MNTAGQLKCAVHYPGLLMYGIIIAITYAATSNSLLRVRMPPYQPTGFHAGWLLFPQNRKSEFWFKCQVTHSGKGGSALQGWNMKILSCPTSQCCEEQLSRVSHSCLVVEYSATRTDASDEDLTLELPIGHLDEFAGWARSKTCSLWPRSDACNSRTPACTLR